MKTENDQAAIDHTTKWIKDVVVGCNFCPFAARELKNNSIAFRVINRAENKIVLETLAHAFAELDKSPQIETLFIILPDRYLNFLQYLDLHELCETLLTDLDYEGIYQIATFHPIYLFSGTTEDDPSNYTNRSPYPMLHILREDSVSKAIASIPDAGKIPLNNIAFTKAKGLLHMQALKDACKNLP